MIRIIYVSGLLLLGILISSTVWAASVTRGPYLQLQTETGITIHWRTDLSTNSMVRYGLSPGNLSQSALVAGSTTEHSVSLTALSTGQKYYYSVGDSAAPIAGDASYYFHTAPVQGVAADTRFWVLGDSGTADNNARAVRDAYSSWASSDPADFWLMLGDNAYNNGTDAEYQAGVFNIYPEMLRQMPLWATLGNHDGASADSGTQTGAYYDIFDLPKNAQAGGLASGTEAYYSFDYANIHFICLDSYDTSRAANGVMMNWLESDLAMNTQPWVIAFWHHPPYTKGSHNSDNESELTEMRLNALPILESWGVDLVMTGHSHTYERSYLIDGHYGTSGTWNTAEHAVDSGNGRPGSNGAYEKPGIIAAQNQGAVYAVAGSSGKVSTGYPLNHPAMFISLEKLGSMIIDVSGNQLDAVFLDNTGSVQDSFSIVKTPDSDPPLISGASAEDTNHVLLDFNEPVNSIDANNAANYSISGLSVTTAALLPGNRSVRLTTSNMVTGTSYTLAVSNVRDLIGNTIVPGSTVNFDYFDLMEQSFQDGIAPSAAYAGTQDSYIRQASATTNYGAATSLQVDGDEPANSTNDMSILLAWDISSIPANAIVEAAEMVLEVTDISSGVYSCFGLERSWNEAQTTWNLAATGTAWGTAGAAGASDRNSTPICAVSASTLGSLTVPFNAAGIARVQAWVNTPASNRGLIISDSSVTNGADFHSSESATALARPRLNVLYRVDTPPPPNNPPVAGFSSSCTDLACNFTDASSDSDGSIVSRSWNFGDGATSSATNPSHSYAAGGTYTVTLMVTDDDGASAPESKSVTVTAPPPPNNPPVAGFSSSCTDLACNFTDTSSDSDGSIVSRSWNFGDGVTSTATNPAHGYAAGGTYTVTLTVTDDDGASDPESKSVIVTAPPPPPYIDQFAQADVFTDGSNSGGYVATHNDDGVSQALTERESGGPKSQRYSYLTHTWQFTVASGTSVMLYANTWSGGSADGDGFQFAWSSDNQNFTDLFLLGSSSPGNVQGGQIDASGTIYIRVIDTNRQAGHKALDTVYVDHLYIRSTNGAPPPNQSPTANFSSSCSGLDCSFTNTSGDSDGSIVSRAWTFGDGATSTLNNPAHSYAAAGTYSVTLTVTDDDGATDAISKNVTVSAASAINLSASGYKNKGINTTNLSWSGASGSNVRVFRDGGVVITTVNDGSHIDSTGDKGGRTYIYKVCEVLPSTKCSNEVTLVF